MTDYTSPDEVRLVLTRDLAQTAGNAASLANETIQEQINSAMQRIDGKLALRYKVPFSDPIPKLIRDIARDIAAFLTDLTFREIRDYGSELNPVYLRYQDAVKLLDSIAKGETVVPGEPPPGESETGTMTVVDTFDGGQTPLGNFFDEPCRGDGPILWGRYG
jgi:phage gp36-like protein